MQPITSKLWCRRAFIALCLLPTLCISTWIVIRSLPGEAAARKAEWERELSQRLGLRVSIGALTYPHFDVAELSQVELTDAQTSEQVGRASTLEITRTATGWGIEATGLEVESRHLSLIASRLHERVLCQRESGDSESLEFAASELTLLDRELPLTLTDIDSLLESREGAPKLTLAFRLAGDDPNGDSARLTLSRSPVTTPPITRLEFQTGSSELPTALLSRLWPEAAVLGPDSHLNGNCDLTLDSNGWTGQLAGRIAGVDLDSLVSEEFPHALSGEALVTFQEVRLEEGRVVSAAGVMEARNGGRISRSLVEAAKEHLQLRANIAADAGDSLAYRRLAIGFRLDGENLRLTGSAATDHAGALLANHSGPLLEASQNHSVPAVALVRMLVPNTMVQVPATRQTDKLLHLLPLPSVSPSTTARRSSHTPTRLGPPGEADGKNVVKQR